MPESDARSVQQVFSFCLESTLQAKIVAVTKTIEPAVIVDRFFVISAQSMAKFISERIRKK